MPGTKLTLQAPADFDLPRDVCSYGYFLLAPNHWDVETQSLFRVLHLEDGATTVRITQLPSPVADGGGGPATPGRRGSSRSTPNRKLSARFDRKLTRQEQSTARQQITRMLRLDESARSTAAFHRVDRRWKKSGQARLFRSPTLFEDVIKTVTSCNVAWPSTINMNARLCEVLGSTSHSGGRAFPTAAKIARTRPATLRARCRVGYRDRRTVDLARLFLPKRGKPPAVSEAWLTDPATSDDDAFNFLKSLPGIGPYAAGNIMQLLGRYSRLALDTESVRHGKAVLGYTGTDRAILKKLADHYEPFGEHKFRSYWFELWKYYESKRGPAHLWDRETIGKTFTAALLKD